MSSYLGRLLLSFLSFRFFLSLLPSFSSLPLLVFRKEQNSSRSYRLGEALLLAVTTSRSPPLSNL